MKIVVLCGGLSTERNISLSSGTKVCEALRARGHRAVLVDLFMGLEDVEAKPEELFDHLPELTPVTFSGVEPDLESVKASRKWRDPSLFGRGVLEICKEADVVYIALHGMNGEDGRLQATFDLLGIPYTGSGYLGSAIAMDKMLTKEFVTPKGVQTPSWKSYHDGSTQKEQIIAESSVPCVVKTPTGGSSVGVYIVHTEEELREAVENCAKYGDDILVEQFVQGREFTCAVLGDRALPSVEIVPLTRFYDYENKYKAGATKEICPGRCSAEIEEKMHETALKVHRALGLRTYSRSDFIVDENDEVWFLEVNTLPGMTPTSLVPQEAAAVGISYGELCEFIIGDALERFGRSN